jgi:hypothetical protein
MASVESSAQAPRPVDDGHVEGALAGTLDSESPPQVAANVGATPAASLMSYSRT